MIAVRRTHRAYTSHR